MEILIATQNKGKVKEYRRLLAHTDFEIMGLDDVGLSQLDIEETGTTFEENALLKARAYAEASGKLCLADDSGLVVDALHGRPGVYSARYGKPGLDDAGRRAYLLEEMRDIPTHERTARFRCVIAICDPTTNETYTVEGACEGMIMTEEHNAGKGFGYDALFQPVGFDKTFAELDPDEKNRISHRGIAAQKLPEILAKLS